MSDNGIESVRTKPARGFLQRWVAWSWLRMEVAKERMISHWSEFCGLASIHGLNYLAQPRRPLLERVWWVLVVLISMAYAGINTWQQYQKLINSPITEIPENYGNLSMIPFPAVTICDNRNSFFLGPYEEDSSKRALNEARLFICGEPHPLSDETDMRKMLEVSLPLNQTCHLSNIFLKKTWSSCTTALRRIITDVGVCHTFNMFSPSEIFTEGTEMEYEEANKSWLEEVKDVKRVWRADHRLSIVLYKQFPSAAFQTLTSDHQGFKIILHSPHEVPMVGHRRNIFGSSQLNKTSIGQYFELPMERKVELRVEPKRTRAGPDLRGRSAEDRRCYFPGEKALSFFRFYSYSNCQLECLANLTLLRCRCADYYMPKDWKSRGEQCRCLNSCNLVEYHAKAYYSCPPDPGEMRWNDNSLSVVMSGNGFMNIERRTIFTSLDFYATSGGIMALFCGMSILSVLEIVYHGSFRLLATFYYNWRRKRRN